MVLIILFRLPSTNFKLISNRLYYMHRASKIRNLGTHFFMHQITCLHTWLCISHFKHLKWLFMHECALMCTSPSTYYKDKVNVRSVPLSINPEPSLGIQTLFHKERNNRQVSCLPRTNQPDNFPSTMFESNEYGHSFPVFVGLRQQGS